MSSLRMSTKGPFECIVSVDVEGLTDDGERASLRCSVRHADGYELTAACVVAAIDQIVMKRAVPLVGCHDAGRWVEPASFFTSIAELGMEIELSL